MYDKGCLFDVLTKSYPLTSSKMRFLMTKKAQIGIDLSVIFIYYSPATYGNKAI